jgi:hypothetical protein
MAPCTHSIIKGRILRVKSVWENSWEVSVRRGRTSEFLQPRMARTEDQHECAAWKREVKFVNGLFHASAASPAGPRNSIVP